MKNFCVPCLSLLLSLLLAACSSTPTIDEMSVRIGDNEDIKIVDMRSIVRNGLLNVQATISNQSKSDMLSYRFKWLGKNGMRVFDDEAWKPVTIAKGQSTDLVGIAPTPDAIDFKLELSAYK